MLLSFGNVVGDAGGKDESANVLVIATTVWLPSPEHELADYLGQTHL
jgi:hypothetical protein